MNINISVAKNSEFYEYYATETIKLAVEEMQNI